MPAQCPDDPGPAEPRPVVAAVADVVDDAGPAAGRRPALRGHAARSLTPLRVDVVPEQLLDPAPALLQPVQRQAEIGDRVADGVVGVVAGRSGPAAPAVAAADRARGGQLRPAAPAPSSTSTSSTWLTWVKLVIVSARSSRPPSIATRWSQICSISPSRCEDDHDRDAELGADPADQLQHRGPARRVQADGRLVEQQQPRVADQRLGQLDPLLHAGRVGADLAVALLVQADVAQRLGGALLGRGRREAGHPAQVGDELGGGDVRRQAVVLGHVAGQRPDPLPVLAAVGAEHAGLPARGRQQAEQDLDQGGLARAVGADQAGDARPDGHGERVQRGDRARVLLGQLEGFDDRRPRPGSAGGPSARGGGCALIACGLAIVCSAAGPGHR